jgi:dihydroorotate dehydrogenase
MYKHIIRPILFLFYPETVHHFTVFTLKTLFKIPGVELLVRSMFCVTDKRLETQFLGLNFKNKVGLAAGFDKDARFFNEMAAFGFSYIEIGTVTPKPQPGNEKPRSFRLKKDKALINRMGFNNLGVKQAVEQLKKYRKNNGLIIGGNIGKNTDTPNEKAVDDYEYCFKELYDYVDYFVVNVSCPNITNLKELQDKDSLEIILRRIAEVRQLQAIKKPVLLKISPDLNHYQVDNVIEIVNLIGIDGLVVTNTTITRSGLRTDLETVQAIGRGGLSGAPLKNQSTELIKYISTKTEGKMPVIGVGGIMNAADALEKIHAGASLVQIYTGFIYDGPGLIKKINKLVLN